MPFSVPSTLRRKRSLLKPHLSLKTRLHLITLLIILITVVPRTSSARFPLLFQETQSKLKALIQAEVSGTELVCSGEIICGILFIPDFYASRDYRPAWGLEKQDYRNAEDLISAIRQADEDGLTPSDYHLGNLSRMMQGIQQAYREDTGPSAQDLAEADLLLTDAFLLFGSHLLGGRVNPETIHTDWKAFRHNADMSAILSRALEEQSVGATLDRLRPPHPGYKALKEALAKRRSEAPRDGWPEVPPGPTLRMGDQDPRVAALRRRLAAEGYPLFDMGDPTYFDAVLKQAVADFQTRNGLAVDGIVGKNTLYALNLPPEARIRQIEINLERWRWIPRKLGYRHILVNIAGFSLQMVEHEKPVGRMRVVVGRPYRKTPVFSSEMTYLVFNPYWNVPHKLAVEDIAPLVRKDPGYLRRQGIKVLSGWEESSAEVDPASIDWSQITKQNFPYRMRQNPGPLNALGSIKFMFPNKYSVYLHDTPKRYLFDRSIRGFSSGCIRVEKPLELALFLLKESNGWTIERIQEAIDARVTRTVSLSKPVPIHLLYWTAWIDEGGELRFCNDIYDRDAALDIALRKRPTAADQ